MELRGKGWGQLVVTTEVIASKINTMKDNKSPGVDEIAPKILKETVERISIPLAHVFNMVLQEGIVPLEWKEANTIPLKKVSRNKSENYRKFKLIHHSQHGFLKTKIMRNKFDMLFCEK